jgi:hypothetical protein
MSNDRLTIAMAAARLLTEARDFIKDRGHWITGSLFSKLDIDVAKESLATAPRVCAIGGVMRAANLGVGHYDQINSHTHREAFEALRVLAGAIQGDMDNEARKKRNFKNWGADIHEYNDNGASHKDIVAAFDRAVEYQCAVVRDLAGQTELKLEPDGKKDHAS